MLYDYLPLHKYSGVDIMMYMLAASIVLALLVRGSLCVVPSSSQAQAALYTTIHDMALPQLKAKETLTERFILLEPGEVLDYCDYTKACNPRLPPDEAAFRLSDAIPSLEPVGGGVTGKSLSTIYSNILYTIDTSTIDDDPFTNKNFINAMNYLQEMVFDPADASAPNVSRTELYQRYKKHYYNVKQQVSQWIIGNKTAERKREKQELQKYDKWYIESYPTLEALASAAHTQWLVDGQKGRVEDKISIINVKSIRSEIESAKNLLQNDGIPSMDGGSNYYPVEFIPSNWHEYLVAE